MQKEQKRSPDHRAVGEAPDLARWAQALAERYPQVTHIYLFGSKARGGACKGDTDIFLMLTELRREEQTALVERLYSDPEIIFPDLDLFLNFPSDGRQLNNPHTGGIIFESATRFWVEGLDYRLLWARDSPKDHNI